MKIFYIAHFDCTTHEGHAAHVRGVVRELAAQGHAVTLFAQNWRAMPHNEIRYIHVPQWRHAGFYTLTFGLLSIPLLLWHLLVQRPAVVYTRFFNTLIFLLPLFWLYRVPLIVEFNADQTTEHRANRRNALRRALWNWAEHVICHHAAGIVVVAPAIASSLQQKFPELRARIIVIENGVDTTEFYPQDALTCRKALHLNPEGHYVVYVGAFQVWQGLQTLVEAAPAVVEAFPDTIFLLVGHPGTEGARLMERITALGLTTHFMLPGSATPELAARYIGAGDVCVAPYNHLAASTTDIPVHGALMKGSPLKIFTYLACGRPVVASHFREAGVFVEEIGAGIAVPPDDPHALSTAIITLLQDPALRARMGASGSTVIQAHHSWKAVAEQLTVFFHKVLEHET